MSGATRERLLVAAKETFGELGYVPTRIDDIVARAGTSHGTFYSYFRDKKAVLDALVGDMADLVFGAVVRPPVEPLRATDARAVVRARLGSFLRACERHGSVFRTWVQAGGVHPDVEEAYARTRRSIVTAMLALLERDRDRGILAAGVRPTLAASAIVALAEGVANEWLSEDRAFTDEDIDGFAELLARALYEPGAGDPG